MYYKTLPHDGKVRYCLFLILALSFFSAPLFAQTFPAGFSRVQVANGISNPTVMAFAPDGRIFVAQQNGTLRIVKNGSLLATPFLQISVNSSGERGLIGLALDPNYASNQYVYVYYTLPDGSRNRISRFTGNGDVVVPGSEVVILNLDPLTTATNHNGGAMHFKNGLLYVAVGENATRANAQNLDTYHGKVLRINPNGSVPAGNPFTTGSEQRRRIWAYGLRNPYTFDIQPGTGRIFVNDVGEGTWEEINDATTGGLNFGWPAAEGNSTNTAYTNPVYAYQHGTGDGRGCAITGGVFFNPTTTNYPAEYNGRYFFQDLCNRWINTLTLSGGTVTRQPFATGLGGDALAIDVGTDGNLYYLERSTGALFRIIYTSTAAPAIATQPANVTVSAGQPATFTVSATGSQPLQYQWQKNNVNIAGATSSSYTLAAAQPADQGAYRVIVSNTAGSVTSNAAQLTVTAFNAAPTAQIITPAEGALYRGGDVITFSGDATDTEDGTLPASAFTWLVDFHHDTHHHDGPPVADGVKSGSFTIPVSGEVSANVWYRLYLIVTDSQGLRDTVYRDIHPHTSVISLATQPAGLQVTLDGQPVTTPLSVTSVEGIQRTIGVVTPQTVGGQTYVFDRWLHGGSASQTISTPTNNVTYTAVYQIASLREPENPASTLSGLQYNYYEGAWDNLPDFNTLTPIETGTVAAPDLSPRNREDDFGFRFTGYINVPTDGLYTFYTNSDDGSQLFIGTTLVVNNDGRHSEREMEGTIGLKAGKHAITITFFERGGAAVLTTSYAGPGLSKQLIPASAFYRANAAAPIVLEAENALLSGPVAKSNQPGYTGTGFIDFVNASNDYVQWTATAPTTGNYVLKFRYALNNSARNLALAVNGTVAQAAFAFPRTGSWSTWSTVSITTRLNAGTNTIRITATGNSGPNIDHLVIEPAVSGVTAQALTEELAFRESMADEDLFLYPNPAVNEVSVGFSADPDQTVDLVLITMQGQIIQKHTVQSSDIDGRDEIPLNVEGVPAGTYLLKLRSGHTTTSRILVIKK